MINQGAGSALAKKPYIPESHSKHIHMGNRNSPIKPYQIIQREGEPYTNLNVIDTTIVDLQDWFDGFSDEMRSGRSCERCRRRSWSLSCLGCLGTPHNSGNLTLESFRESHGILFVFSNHIYMLHL